MTDELDVIRCKGNICYADADAIYQVGWCSTRLTRMQSCDEIVGFLEHQPHILKLLGAVEALGIEECWIGAGIIRNAVWNHLHGFATDTVAGSDVDVVYCDARDASLARDLSIEAQLFGTFPDVPWSVHNQARMHVPNGDPPYRDVGDAIRCWPETATAIAARMIGGDIKVLAPHGVEDLVGLIVRPTPTFARKLSIYQERISKKAWARRWPRLQFVDC